MRRGQFFWGRGVFSLLGRLKDKDTFYLSRSATVESLLASKTTKQNKVIKHEDNMYGFCLPTPLPTSLCTLHFPFFRSYLPFRFQRKVIFFIYSLGRVTGFSLPLPINGSLRQGTQIVDGKNRRHPLGAGDAAGAVLAPRRFSRSSFGTFQLHSERLHLGLFRRHHARRRRRRKRKDGRGGFTRLYILLI